MGDRRERLERGRPRRGALEQGAAQWAADRGARAGDRAYVLVRRMGRVRRRRRRHDRYEWEPTSTVGRAHRREQGESDQLCRVSLPAESVSGRLAAATSGATERAPERYAG